MQSSSALRVGPLRFAACSLHLQTLMLSNTQPFPAEFKWQLDGPAAAAFTVSPIEGTIRGSNSLQCTVKWQPGSDAVPGEQLVG